MLYYLKNTNIFILSLLVTFFFSCNNGLQEEKRKLFFQENSEAAIRSLEQMMGPTGYQQSTNANSETTYERFKLIHISDPHLSEWTADNNYAHPINLMEAIEFANLPQLKINAFVATGDFISNKKSTSAFDASLYQQSFNSFLFAKNNVPTFICTGNHDTNMLTNNTQNYLSKQDLHRLLFAKTNYPLCQPQGENYYYADIPNPSGGTIRIIALDNTDQKDFTHNSLHTSCITQKQIDWLTEIALTKDMSKNHNVIILTHHPLQKFSKDLSTYMCSGTHLYEPHLIPDIINAFIKKQALNRTYHSTLSPKQSIIVKHNFSGSPGDFICYMGGHAHTPAYFEVSCNDNQQAKQIMLLANTLSPDLQNNNYNYVYRKKENLNSNSFSIYAIDIKEKNIYITDFGAKSNNISTIRTISYR